jgi:hypothetical protein
MGLFSITILWDIDIIFNDISLGFFLLVPLSHFRPVANLALPSRDSFWRQVSVRVFLIERVPTLAVCFCRISCTGGIYATGNIFFLSDSVKMIWVTARRVSAQVVKAKAFRDFANKQSVDNPMRESWHFLPRNIPISKAVLASGPVPAAKGWIDRNLFLDSFWQVFNFKHRFDFFHALDYTRRFRQVPIINITSTTNSLL